jgi:thymidylate synthase
MIPEDFVYFMGNTHIYCDHVEALKEQIKREPLSFPKINISTQKKLEEYTIDDIEWISKYTSHDTIKMAMSA